MLSMLPKPAEDGLCPMTYIALATSTIAYKKCFIAFGPVIFLSTYFIGRNAVHTTRLGARFHPLAGFTHFYDLPLLCSLAITILLEMGR